MAFTEQLTQALAVLGQQPSSNLASGTTNVGGVNSATGIDMSVIRRLIAYLDIGTLGASANVQFWFEASANANMNVVTNMGTTTMLTSSNSNRVSSLEVRADQLPAGTRYVRGKLLVNTAASNVGCIILGGESGYKPANQYDTTNVADQRIAT